VTRPKNGTTPPAVAADAVAAQRSLIEALLVTHAQLDVYTMLTASVSGAGITYEQVRYARKRMIREGKPVWVGPRPTPKPRTSSPSTRTRPVKIDPSELLRRAMVQMFERKAKSLGCSVATAKILTLYSPAQISRMADATATEVD
jgi:hypothetical protein